MSFAKKYLLEISILSSAIFISLMILLEYNLNTLQGIFGIISSSSIGVALYTYSQKIKQDKLFASTEQISFFRKEIIPASDNFLKMLMKDAHLNSYQPSNLRLSHPTLVYVKNHYFDESRKQMDFLVLIEKDRDLNSALIQLLNAMEEFSLRIIYSETINHDSLKSLKETFINLAEQNAMKIILMHEISSNKNYYNGILDLYGHWEPEFNRTPPMERLQKILDEFNPVQQ